MQAAQLRRRIAKMEESARRLEKDNTSDDPKKTQLEDPTIEQLRLASFKSRSRASAVGRGRIQAILSAIAIGVLLLLIRTQRSREPPEAYALCSAYGERNIWTVSEGDARVECMVINGKFIADTGSIDEIRQRWGDRATTGPVIGAPAVSRKSGLKFIYLEKGQAAYPGFHDAHAHVLQWGWASQLPLRGSRTIDEILSKVKHYIQATPLEPGAWIEGQGWDQTLWGGDFPTAADLDKDPLLKDKPIVLARTDVHAYWVSGEVIRRLGPLPDKVDGGEIVRDADGNPTGIFLDNAMMLIDDAKPQWTDAQRLRFFRRTVTDALAVGLTTIHDAATYVPDINFFKKMAIEGKLPLRLYLMGHVSSDTYWGAQLPNITTAESADGRLMLRAIKIFGDGALGSWGSALLEPYSDRPDTTGILRVSPEVLRNLIVDFYKNGWQVNTHCIGDRANKIVLDAYEEVLKGSTDTDRRLRIEHAQILTLDDLKRMGRLGVIASVQPTHATSDMGYAETRLGPERIKGAYAWRTLIENGATVATGSDFPVEGINPLLGFYAAVTRLAPDGTSPHGPGGWYPEQRMTRHEALRGMTSQAAYASFQEHKVGRIAKGLRADVTILSQDIMTVRADQILEAVVAATLIDGRVVYGKLKV
ncbi:amidohydrolase family protein [Rhizoctonia solani AG-3 Rhs1AP]|uniref:Amidohydrolase family protein n=2 Tax=Rhizoctonia solani TaxID=456999 RepID=X8JHN4_9AGAM|nr:amidohydrolase family protein [Rhizoctonia solani AG-3 Rhs1AP]